MNAQLAAEVDTQTTNLLADVDGLDADTELHIAQVARDAATATYGETQDAAWALCQAELAAINEIDAAGA